MINASKTPIPSDDVWWQRVHTESGLSTVLKLRQFKELFQFISDEAVDRSIMTLIQTDETERFERVLSLEGLRHILECEMRRSRFAWNDEEGSRPRPVAS